MTFDGCMKSFVCTHFETDWRHKDRNCDDNDEMQPDMLYSSYWQQRQWRIILHHINPITAESRHCCRNYCYHNWYQISSFPLKFLSPFFSLFHPQSHYTNKQKPPTSSTTAIPTAKKVRCSIAMVDSIMAIMPKESHNFCSVQRVSFWATLKVPHCITLPIVVSRVCLRRFLL